MPRESLASQHHLVCPVHIVVSVLERIQLLGGVGRAGDAPSPALERASPISLEECDLPCSRSGDRGCGLVAPSGAMVLKCAVVMKRRSGMCVGRTTSHGWSR
eukprot:357565-Chlamydomonas_euryale.AAC.7